MDYDKNKIPLDLTKPLSERQAEEIEPQRGRQADRAGADHDDGRDGAHRSTLLRRVGDVPADDRRSHRRLIGQQEEERADQESGTDP